MPTAAADPAHAAAVADAVTAALLAGAEGARGLWLPDNDGNGVPRVPAHTLTRASFFRDYVAPNRPVVITGAMEGWRARRLWGREYLSRGALGDTRVSVNVTPTGWADALHTVVMPSTPPTAGAASDAPARMVAPLGGDHPAATCICAAVAGAGDGAGGGTGPAATATWFVKPEERAMTLREAVAMIGARRRRGTSPSVPEVAYLSHQNDSLRAHTPQLLADLGPEEEGGSGGGGRRGTAAAAAAAGPQFHFSPWGGRAPPDNDEDGEEEGGSTAADTSKLEAVNLWLGDARSTSSAHKDHFENLYAVVAGAKTFTLLPPTDVAWLYEGVYPVGRYARAAATAGDDTATEGDAPPLPPPLVVPGWVVVPEMAEADDNRGGAPGAQRRTQATVPWVSLAVDGTPGACAGGGADGRCRRFPCGHHARRLCVTVAAGEVLYLPALWYHQVGHAEAPSSDFTAAVNWWVDMRFDGPLWAAYSLARALAPLVQQQQQQQQQQVAPAASSSSSSAKPLLDAEGEGDDSAAGGSAAASSPRPT